MLTLESIIIFGGGGLYFSRGFRKALNELGKYFVILIYF